jgi:hypothetical protein
MRSSRQPILDERQWLTAQRLLDHRRLDVHHSVLEPELGPCLAIVYLVRVQHHRPAGQAMAPAAAILKTLHTGQCIADGISIVTVQVVAMARKKRLETLKPADIGGPVKPVIVRWEAGHGHVVSSSMQNTLTQ